MNNWANLFTEMIDMINAESKSIEESVQNDKKIYSDLFEPAVTLTRLSDRELLRGKRKLGIYLFMMTEDVHLSAQQVKDWCSRPTEAGLHSSLEQELHKGDCLYLGSVYSKTGSLFVRLGQHWGPQGNEEPHGLALNHKNRMAVNGKVKTIVYPLKREYHEFAPLLLPRIEKVLHNAFSPKAGSSRT